MHLIDHFHTFQFERGHHFWTQIFGAEFCPTRPFRCFVSFQWTVCFVRFKHGIAFVRSERQTVPQALAEPYLEAKPSQVGHKNELLLLMAEILHQLIGSFSVFPIIYRVSHIPGFKHVWNFHPKNWGNDPI